MYFINEIITQRHELNKTMHTFNRPVKEQNLPDHKLRVLSMDLLVIYIRGTFITKFKHGNAINLS